MPKENNYWHENQHLGQLSRQNTHLSNLSDMRVHLNNNVIGDGSDGLRVFPYSHDEAAGKCRALFSDANHNLKVKDDDVLTKLTSVETKVNSLVNYGGGGDNDLGDGQVRLQTFIYGHDGSSNMRRVRCDTNGRLELSTNYENQTLAGVSALTVYGSNNGTSIDVNGYRHLVIKVRSTATTGASPLQNLRLYYSNDDSDFTMGEIIKQNELPGSSTNYQGIIRIENVGFRYVRLIAIGVTASPTAYYVHYSRSN